MNKIELYDNVELLEDYIEENVIPHNNTIYKKGSIGIVIELYNEHALVEFSYEEYTENITTIPLSLLKK